MAKICKGDAAWVACDKCENLGALPGFPALEGVLATKTREEKIGGTDDGVHKSITDDDFGLGLVLVHSVDMQPNTLGSYPIPSGPS